MPLSGPSKRALARIQRLCCLGIGGEMRVPDLMREVAVLIPSRHGVFHWLGPKLEITNTYHTFPAEVMELYFKEFFETQRENAVIKPFNRIEGWPVPNPVLRFERTLLVDRRTFQRSEFYNVLWRAADIDDSLMSCARDRGQVRSLLHIYRSAGDAPFNPDDVRMLESIVGFVAHGMSRADLGEEAFAGIDDRALFVADLNGKVRHAGDRAQHLLMMALNPRLSPTANRRGLGKPVPEIARLCCALAATASGKVGQAPPILRLKTPWGEFVLRAYWLGGTDDAEQSRQIGITIERRVPRVLALRRRIEALALTAREKQLCMLLVCNPSGHDLAEAMGLATSTVITHQRSVYAKLSVHSRSGLFAVLETGLDA
jgi:DNA-binding CsgD family transcriptional regulator